MHQRVLLSETNSELAKELIAQLPEIANTVVCQINTDYPTENWKRYSHLLKEIREAKPDYVVILPGHDAFEIENFALIALITGIRVIYVSDVLVFDGMKSISEKTGIMTQNGGEQIKMTFVPYTEYDFPRPITERGMQCLHGEQYIQRYVKRYTIVRPGYLFDEITIKMIDPAKAIPLGDPLVHPTPITDFATAITILIDKAIYGVYHIASPGESMALSKLILKYQPFVKIDLKDPKPGQAYPHNQMITGHKFSDRTGHFLPTFNKEK